jgi:hypothetical protein
MSDDFSQLIFAKAMQHGATTFNPLAVTFTSLDGFNESEFGATNGGYLRCTMHSFFPILVFFKFIY